MSSSSEIVYDSCGRVEEFMDSNHVTLTEYLRTHFKYPELIIAAMADTHAAIIADRALEFFMKGSCSERSAWSRRWDFITPSDTRMVDSLAAALYYSGVNWDGHLFELQKAVLRGEVGIVTLSRDQIFENSIVPSDQFSFEGSASNARITSFASAVTVWCDMQSGITDESSIESVVLKYDFSNGFSKNAYTIEFSDIRVTEFPSIDTIRRENERNLCVLTGHIMQGDVKVGVRIICQGFPGVSGSITDMVHFCGSTRSMCLLTAFYGIHMFHSHLVTNKSVALSTVFDGREPLTERLPSGVTEMHLHELNTEFIGVRSPSCKYYRFSDIENALGDQFYVKSPWGKHTDIRPATASQQKLIEESCWYVRPASGKIQFEYGPEHDTTIRQLEGRMRSVVNGLITHLTEKSVLEGEPLISEDYVSVSVAIGSWCTSRFEKMRINWF